jgi:hypothetical protein
MSIASKRDTQYSRARGVTNTQDVAQLKVCTVILQLHPNLLHMSTRCFSSVSKLTAPCPFPRLTGPIPQPRDPAYAVVIYSSSRDYGRPLGIRRTREGMLPPFRVQYDIASPSLPSSTHNSKTHIRRSKAAFPPHRNDQNIQECFFFTAR